MKSVLSLLLVLGSLNAFASSQIENAVDGISYLAHSGVEVYTVKPGQNVKSSLLELALNEEVVDDKADFDASWKGLASDAWEADSTNWGESSMKEAYGYIFSADDSDEEGTDMTAGKKAFKLLLKSGVQFGVAPLGAVQCGVRFAGLAIIDPATGKVYIFSREGSGC